ncbi:basic salivary proline-rich protein 1-like isoform X1 [Passer montanus]|uniref:basic salivary proline-rich protein 1-like isoform X1 n=1 Tax=Passer montanus TaxID=9160 RepID=UPI00196176AA|nr:basic salivary proline-rich protein 1-like isoform X1 [Passer montanus]
MFPPPGCRRGFPREPAPWWDGPWPCAPAGPEEPWHEPAWDGPPWDGPAWDGPAWDEPPWDEPAWDEPAWDDHQPRRRRRRRHPPRPFPGPGDVPWKEEEEEDRRWAPHGCPQPPPWGDRGALPGPEGDFGECWYQDPVPEPWPEYPEEEQPPPRPPARPAGNPGTFREHHPPWSHRPAPRPRGHPRQLIPVPRARCPRAPRGHKPHSQPSKRSQPLARKEPPEPPQPPAAPQGAAERLQQPRDVPVGAGGVLEPPSPARSPLESPAADPGAAELLVELEAGHPAVGSRAQDPCAPGAEPAPPEETPRNPEIQERLEVEPCSPGVPQAGSTQGSHPQSPAAPPDPAKGELLDSSSSGEAGAELSPHSWQQLPRGAGETEAEAAQDGPLQSLQPPENPQLPPGPAAEPEAQPSQASPETSPGPQHPPGAGETNLAVCGQQQLCPVLPTPFPAGIDPRSAAVLKRKAKIELSYQQFSLSIAVVATMLLQKEPSLEAALGLALRANLRQGRLHHLQQLQDFIDSLDAGSPGL